MQGIENRVSAKSQSILFHSWIHVRKKSRSNHYERRVQHLKESFPPEWWKETKKVSCITNFSGAKDTVLKAAHQLDCVSDLSPTKIIGLHGRLNFRRPDVWFRRPHLEFLSPPTFDLNL